MCPTSRGWVGNRWLEADDPLWSGPDGWRMPSQRLWEAADSPPYMHASRSSQPGVESLAFYDTVRL